MCRSAQSAAASESTISRYTKIQPEFYDGFAYMRIPSDEFFLFQLTTNLVFDPYPQASCSPSLISDF